MKFRIPCILIDFIAVILYSAPIKGQCVKTINVNNGLLTYSDGYTKTIPERDITVLSDGIIVSYTFNQIIRQDDPFYPGSYFINVDGFGRNNTVGEPSVLFRMDSFTLPIGTVGSVEIIDSSYVELPFSLAPSRPLLNDMDYNSYSLDNVPPIKPYIGTFPQNLIQETETSAFRGNNIFDVYLTPMKYDYTNGKVYFYHHITYKITFTQTDNSNHVLSQRYDNTDNLFLRNMTINGSSIIPHTKPTTRMASSQMSPIKKDYLIISTPKYHDAVNRFAQWKRLLGFNVHKDLKNSWSVSQIDSSVCKIGNNLVYLLIIGDHEDVPAKDTTYVNHFYTDYYYGCINNDKYQEVCVGRLPVSNINEAEIVVDKIINYEKYPVNDSAFYNTGLICTYFQDGIIDNKPPNGREDKRYALTSEEISKYMVDSLHYHVNRVYCAEDSVFPTYWSNYFSMGEEIPSYLKKENGFLWNGSGLDIKNNINEGVFFVVHRDHGSANSWWRPNFTNDSINNLSNQDKLPVVFSINCSTGKFTENSCFAETFLRKEDGGCVAIFCPTEDTFSGHNDILLLGMFNAIWPNPGISTTILNEINTDSCRVPIYSLGDILRQGKKVLDESNYEDIYIRNYTRGLYQCLGDPSMLIYTEKPSVFNHVNVKRTPNKLFVELGGECGTITFFDQMADSIASFVGEEAEYSGNDLDSVMVCVSGHNKIPYIVNPNQNDFYFIQNDTIQENHIFRGNVVKVGTDVTDIIPHGNVVFDGGKTTIIGKEVTIKGETTIKLGTEFEIRNE